jgi:hypothetical protein
MSVPPPIVKLTEAKSEVEDHILRMLYLVECGYSDINQLLSRVTNIQNESNSLASKIGSGRPRTSSRRRRRSGVNSCSTQCK